MKKFALVLSLVAFFLFGAISIQDVVSATTDVNIELVNFDKDPVKDGKDKKASKDKAKKDKSASKKQMKGECSDKSAKSCATKTSCCSSKKKGGDKK